MSSNPVLGPPPYREDISSSSWKEWFKQLYVRVGQASAPTNNSILSNPMTTLGDTLYENNTPAVARVPGNTTLTKKFYTQTGTGSVSASPGWDTISSSDVPTLNQNTTGTSASVTGTNVVANSNLSQMNANTIKGNNTGSTANAKDLTLAQVNAILPVFTSTLNGLTPLSGGGTTNFLRADGTWAAAGGGSGTVTSASVTTANGFAGTVANATTTPAITVSTTVTGVLKGNATAISAATSGTDFSAGTSALGTGILKSTTTTGALTIAVAADFPTLNQNTSGSAASLSTTLAIASGGTNKTSVTTAPTASSWAGWDANKNLSANNFIPSFTTTATAAGTTVMTIASTEVQVWTGSTTQIVKLPTTSVVAGAQYLVINLSSGNVTVQSSAANTIQILAANSQGLFTALVATPTTAANWNCCYQFLVGTGGSSGVTSNYFNGSMPNGTFWSTTSTSQSAFTLGTGTNTLSTIYSNGITVAAGASNLPSVALTPAAATSVYQVTASFTATVNSAGQGSFFLTDGTTNFAFQNTAITSEQSVTLTGIYAFGSASAATLSIQGQLSNTNTLFIQNNTNTPSVAWQIVQIK